VSPPAQAAHTLFVTAVPAVATYWPAGQSRQATQAVAALLSSSQVPAPQATGSAVPPAQKVPGSQAVHLTGEVEVAAVVWRWPGEQAPADWQVLALVCELYSPTPQAAQVRFAVEVPAASTWVPAAQSLHAVQVVALARVLNCPLAQGEHWRLV